MASTLVEMVSINCEDFSDSFLTCATCLCMYDAMERTPKLLSCSHTVCRSCLEKIVQSQLSEAGTFRCPICRESITVPRGGVGTLPPSFIVNQLLDLLTSQRKDWVPRCAQHPSQELFFCETCDTVFCNSCSQSAANKATTLNDIHAAALHAGRAAAGHTIVPFSVALKRMSEIVQYKTRLCQSSLDSAAESVREEIKRLEEAGNRTEEAINSSFEEVLRVVEKRKGEVLQTLKTIFNEKKRVLEEQLCIIAQQQQHVSDASSESFPCKMEVRSLSKRISELNERVDSVALLAEPRENAFIRYDFHHNTALQDLQRSLGNFGRLDISTTFPALCTAVVRPSVTTNLSTTVTLFTVDYRGKPRTQGGDPVKAVLCGPSNIEGEIPVRLVDLQNGTYKMHFRPAEAGRHRLTVTIFDRPIKCSPFYFESNDHNNPLGKVGGKSGGSNNATLSLNQQSSTGNLSQSSSLASLPLSVSSCSGGVSATLPNNMSPPTSPDRLFQPTAVAVDGNGQVFVLDTGNCRICVLTPELNHKYQINAQCLTGQSCTSMALTGQQSILLINWRTCAVTEISATPSGQILHQFTHTEFKEPVAIASIDNGKGVLVADNGAGCIFRFDRMGKLLGRIGTKSNFKMLCGLAVTIDGHLICSDSKLLVFSLNDGQLVRQIEANKTVVQSLPNNCSNNVNSHQLPQKQPAGSYGGVATDVHGNILATRSERGRSVVEVFNSQYQLISTIDSHEDKLRRPAGLACSRDGQTVLVADLGNDSVKMFRYA